MPLGIIILGILMLIGGLWSIIWGLGLGAFGGMSWLTGLLLSDSMQAWGGNAVGAALWSILIGIVQVVTSFGLFTGQRWAWLLALISAGAALITPLIGLLNGSLWSVFGLIIPGLIFFYLLFDNDVKRAFGRA
jgi:hypothetical protein